MIDVSQVDLYDAVTSAMRAASIPTADGRKIEGADLKYDFLKLAANIAQILAGKEPRSNINDYSSVEVIPTLQRIDPAITALALLDTDPAIERLTAAKKYCEKLAAGDDSSAEMKKAAEAAIKMIKNIVGSIVFRAPGSDEKLRKAGLLPAGPQMAK